MESTIKTLPEDILREIMVRMSLKCVLKCTCLSKEWKKIILGKYFKKCYLNRSMTRPRLLFVFRPTSDNQSPNLLFHSVYQEENPLLSSGEQQMRSSDSIYALVSAPIRGLVCLQSKTKIVLCNPGTNKILTLPECKARKGYYAGECFFGYDEVEDVFKVLWSEYNKSDGAIQHRVFTLRFLESDESFGAMQHRVLEAGETSWRPIVYEHPYYYAFTNALFIRGVLYYGVWSREKLVGLNLVNEKKPKLMSFNVRSEEFTLLELPEGVEKMGTKLVNYNGKVALVIRSEMKLFENEKFQIRVRDESEGIWRLKRFVMPGLKDIANDMWINFKGTIGTGELIFPLKSVFDKSHFVLYYNPITQNLRKFKIEGMNGDSYHYGSIFLNHFDSLLLT